MPSFAEIQTRLHGAWRLMNGKSDGLKQLDLSADGFWNSFFAIVVALPPLFAAWVESANNSVNPAASAGARLSVVPRLALIELAAWVLPLLVLALVARRLGIGDRFVAYAVASNWATSIVLWMTVPAILLRLFSPAADQVAGLLALAIPLLSLVFSWRLTNASLEKGAAVATGVFFGMFLLSMVVILTLQGALGLYPAPSG